jgi:L-amino acid N-acyltransferase YncA
MPGHGRAARYDGPRETGDWVLEFDGAVVGLAHLRHSTELPAGVADIGYFLDPAHDGRGLATEAAAALLRHGFARLGLPAIWALIHETNVASRKLAEQMGFLDMGSRRHYGDPHRVYVVLPTSSGRLHHVELWVPDVERAEASLGWLLTELGWSEYQRWSEGVTSATATWSSNGPRRSPRPATTAAVLASITSRCTPEQVRIDEVAERALAHGWRPLFADRYPHAGGPGHYAAYLENADGFEVELVAFSAVAA